MTLNTLNKPAEWVAPTQYGKLIASYCYGDAKWREALVGLSEIQRVWATTGKAAGLLLSIFVQLHQQDAMEDRGFVAWKNNCTLTVAIPGKSEAVAQLSAYALILESPPHCESSPLIVDSVWSGGLIGWLSLMMRKNLMRNQRRQAVKLRTVMTKMK
jgi:hypothetical protein